MIASRCVEECYPVEVRDEARGVSRRFMVPLPRDVIVESLRDAEARDDSGPAPGLIEVVGHVRPDSITLRYWSPSESAEGREAVAAAILEFEEACR